MVARKQPVKQCRTRASDMQIARGRGGETGHDGVCHGGLSVLYNELAMQLIVQCTLDRQRYVTRDRRDRQRQNAYG
jgi:acyl-coenzyme A thioesterase PaaI-like protein